MIDIAKLKNDLECKGFISKIYYFDEIDSTNIFASRIETQADSLIISEFQNSGKGRFNKSWVSDKYSNLTFTIKKLLPLPYSLNQIAAFYFSYSIYTAIKEYLLKYISEIELNGLQIKWPNDIIFNRQKLCGILIESKIPGNNYILGCGINCNQEVFPEELNAISIKNIIKQETDLNLLMNGIIRTLRNNYDLIINDSYTEIFKSWKNCTNLIGKSCEYSINNGTLKYGKISNLNIDGSIEIISNNITEKHHSGEIKILVIS
ncbi:MAG: biotin--[acetyl-CoA-carboxylase] ligase [Ignavibacteria bacterium]|nr:biotin--[acetyl-CoA-carboxylase] ligase [Ignavibacteria bacterium]